MSVVADGSNPSLDLDPERWAAKFNLKVTRQQNTELAGARNRGVTEARIDDDCLATPTWLENLVAALRKIPRRWLGARPSTG